ncbi:hypothetical protein X760_09970 [Mesorhizobium sp. LSHC422A00]|nr:hypothetical protein X760_09970 [Mesorhizobium sp. LSHC422A00]
MRCRFSLNRLRMAKASTASTMIPIGKLTRNTQRQPNRLVM